MKVISLFSGAGGLDIGFKNAGYEIAVCVEQDKACCETLALNMPHVPIINADIRSLSTKDILKAAKLKPREAALVIGGPPCQPFSLAGKRGGFLDPRGTLFQEFVRVVKESAPKGFLMENVKGILNWNSGAAIKTILYELSQPFQHGRSHFEYTVTQTCVDAADYGEPQHRERVFIVGTLSKAPFRFPEPTHVSPDELALRRQRTWNTVGKALQGLPEPDAPSATALRVSKTILLRHKALGYEE